MKKILIVGATSLIAEHCARLWAADPTHFVLAARGAAKLDRIAQDLRARSPVSTVECHTPSFDDPAAIDRFVGTVFETGAIDIALVAHGTLPDQQACQRDLVLMCEALTVNAISPVMFAEALAARMETLGQGTIAVIGSVAGDRGRRSNYVYGSAKGLVDRYVQGMQHRFAKSAVQAILIKPGPTDTPMTAGFRKPGVRLADPAAVAMDITRGIRVGARVIYTPRIWRLVMLVIRHIPARVFGGLDL